MEYAEIEVSLQTNKTRDYLWEKLNTPEKIIQIEQFEKPVSTRQISQQNYELRFGKRLGFIALLPKKGVNMTFILEKDSSIAWFEIIGQENCELVHGTSVRIDDDNGQWLKENKKKIKEHFLEELAEIAK